MVQMPGLLDADALSALQQRTQGADRNRMLREIADALEVLATERPLVLWLEDLHWSDYATLDLIAYLARLRRPAHLLVIGTYRPVDVILNSHPLKTVKQELQMHGQCQELPMEGLGPEAVAEYLAARFPEHRFRAKLSQTLYECTEGNPLFLTNVVEDWEERGILKRSSGIWTAERSAENATQSIPDSLRDMLERQIGGLATGERALLEAASIVGMSFSPAAVAAGLMADIEQIEQQCEVLTRKHQYVRRSPATAGEQTTTHYSFLHALFRRTWEEQIPPTRLARLHLRIGAYKEAEYGEHRGDIASELAHHFYSANYAIKAIAYFRLAGERATARGAMVEGERHYARALELIGALPEDRERDRSELQLQLATGPVLIALKGFGAPEAERAYTRAMELCERLDDPPEIYPASFGLWVMYFLRGEFTKAYALAEQLLRRAQISSDLTPLPLAEMALGNASYQMGKLSLARKHVEQAMSHYDPDRRGAATIRDMGFDARVSGLSAIALTLWHLGYPDQALARAEEGLALARGLSHLHSLAHAEFFVGFVHQHRREASAAREHAEAVIALSAEQGFALWSAWATTLRGSAMSQQGHREEGVTQIQNGLAMSLAAGIKLSRPDFLCIMAEEQMEAGRLDDGRRALTEALAIIDEYENRLCEAEAYRLKGESLLKQGHAERSRTGQASLRAPLGADASNAAEARSCFERAIGIARKQSAKSWELRATTSLARLLAKQGQTDDARTMLAEIYNWFTEGFDTKDLQEAEQLLNGLS
jgi:predicted ATPase